MNSKIIMLIYKEKEEIKAKQRDLLIKYGFGKHSREIDKQISESFFKMADEKNLNNDYNTFIELEKDYIECNMKLVEYGRSHEYQQIK